MNLNGFGIQRYKVSAPSSFKASSTSHVELLLKPPMHQTYHRTVEYIEFNKDSSFYDVGGGCSVVGACLYLNHRSGGESVGCWCESWSLPS